MATIPPDGVLLAIGAHTLRLRSASDVRDALLASFADAPTVGSAKTIADSGTGAEPAWLWLGRLLRARSDWRAAAGVALQHAVAAGERRWTLPALCDLVIQDGASATILDWTAPMAAMHPDALSSDAHWREHDRRRVRLEDAVAAQRAMLAVRGAPDYGVIVSDLFGDDPQLRRVADVQALEAVLSETSSTVRWHRSAWGEGPWGWLYEEVVYRPWIADALPEAFAHLLEESAQHIWPILSFIEHGWDTWRYEALLAGWADAKPEWWNDAVDTKPPGWLASLAPRRSERIERSSDLVTALLAQAKAQRASTPDEDLRRLG